MFAYRSPRQADEIKAAIHDAERRRDWAAVKAQCSSLASYLNVGGCPPTGFNRERARRFALKKWAVAHINQRED